MLFISFTFIVFSCRPLDIVSHLSTDQQYFGARGGTCATRFNHELQELWACGLHDRSDDRKFHHLESDQDPIMHGHTHKFRITV